MAEQDDKTITGAADTDAPPAETTFEPDATLTDDAVDFESAADDVSPDEAAPAPGGADTQDAADGATGAPATAAGATIQSLKDNAATIGRSVGDKAKGYAEDGKARAGDALDELVRMMTDAAGTVDDKVGAQYGQYARTAADAVSGFSESLKAKNVDDLIADATSFVKKSPAIAIGTAAAIGFVLVRLVQSGLNADLDDRA